MHGNAKLNQSQVLEIQNQLWQGKRQVDLAEMFDVTQQTISRIKRGTHPFCALNVPPQCPTCGQDWA